MVAGRTSVCGGGSNSDVNGCLNIGRKEFGDDWLKKLVETDKGCLMQPVTVRIGQ